MIKITIISVGKLKEKYWQQSVDEYVKRLKPYVKLNFINLTEEKINDVSNIDNILAVEVEKIIKSIPKHSRVISLVKEGKNYDSEALAKKINQWSEFGKEITFIIGGPLGLSEKVLSHSDENISLSKMTFTHQMAKVILMEQIYRGIMIQRGQTYHY